MTHIDGTYKSGNYKISKCVSHKDLFTISDGSGKFWSITASDEYMLAKYPPGETKVRVKHRFDSRAFDNAPTYGVRSN